MSNELRATKGPYHVEPNETACVIISHGQSLAAVWPTSLLGGELPMEANAHLLASSWELYEALKKITDCYGVGYIDTDKFCSDVHDFMLEGRVALAKARGEQ